MCEITEELRKVIESIIRAMLYHDSKIVFVCPSQEKADICFNRFNSIINQSSNILNPEIEEKSNAEIKFKNGSTIEIITPKKREEVIRGKRSSINHWWFDWEGSGIDNETLDNVLNPFASDSPIVKKDQKLLYCSSSDRT